MARPLDGDGEPLLLLLRRPGLRAVLLKFGTYFPYTAKLCLNGHEYVKRQLARAGIAFEALDNGLLPCADPRRAQALCDGLSAAKIDRLVRKWLTRLPLPFPPADRRAGYRYDVSNSTRRMPRSPPEILQAEFSLTQVLDRPATGRIFFEEVIRKNLDIGRPAGRGVTSPRPPRLPPRGVLRNLLDAHLAASFPAGAVLVWHGALDVCDHCREVPHSSLGARDKPERRGAPLRGWRRLPTRAATLEAPRRDDDDRHPRPEPSACGVAEPDRPALRGANRRVCACVADYTTQIR